MRIATHELKTPMTSIKGYTKLIQMGAVGELSEKQAEFLNIVTNNVDRMDRLVQDLLDVSRIEAGRIRLEIQDVQMPRRHRGSFGFSSDRNREQAPQLDRWG